ncbi:MAG: alanine racemase [Mycobacteriales bacterium]
MRAPTAYDAPAVEALRDRPISLLDKGFGGSERTCERSAREIARAGLALHDGDFILPVMTLRQNALEHNIAAMARFCAEHGVELAPHAKTTMSPPLFARQLDAGAWGLTAATVGHVQVYRAFGVGRVLLANQLVDPAAIRWVMAERRRDPEFAFSCYVDGADGIAILAAAAGHEDAPLDVLIELGHAGGRTGVRDDAAARDLARRILTTPGLRLAGVSAYEGSVGPVRTPETLDGVAALCDRVAALAHELVPATGSFIVSAGGSAYPDVVAERLSAARDVAVVVLRSGSYLTHDHGMYAEVSPFARPDSAYALRPALELWTHVLSHPEPGLALLSIGRRDAPFDAGWPVPLRVRGRGGEVRPAGGMAVVHMNDQHAFLRLDDPGSVSVGEALCLGISHPCTAFDKWRQLPVVDDRGIVVDVVPTFF